MLRQGDRVVLSQLARQNNIHPQFDPDRIGTVTRVGDTVCVRWDGNKYVSSIAAEYLEQANAGSVG